MKVTGTSPVLPGGGIIEPGLDFLGLKILIFPTWPVEKPKEGFFVGLEASVHPSLFP